MVSIKRGSAEQKVAAGGEVCSPLLVNDEQRRIGRDFTSWWERVVGVTETLGVGLREGQSTGTRLEWRIQTRGNP